MPPEVRSRRAPGRAAIVCTLIVPVAAAGAAVWWWSPGEDLDRWRAGAPPRTWAALERQDQRWMAEGSRRRVQASYVPLGRISVDLQLAVLVGEDIDFFGHGPVDLDAIWEALEDYRAGGRLRGASTISQQLAKNLFLSGERTLWRKLKEVRLAWWLERRLGKRRVLELYLNVVELGPGLVGAEAAAEHYFGAPAAALTVEQAAGLAATIPAPGRDNPATESRRWRNRQGIILRRMAKAEWLHHRLETLTSQPSG